MKTDERFKARELRQQGHSINGIVALLGVSKSSVSLWVRDIVLTEQQVVELAQKGHTTSAIEKRNKIINAAARRIKKINKKDSLPNGVMDIYVLNTILFLTIKGWARGIFSSY